MVIHLIRERDPWVDQILETIIFFQLSAEFVSQPIQVFLGIVDIPMLSQQEYDVNAFERGS